MRPEATQDVLRAGTHVAPPTDQFEVPMNLWLLLALGLLTTLALGIGVINRIFPPSPPPLEKGRDGGDRAGT